MTQLARAGFAVDDVNRMTDAVLNLARATGTDATLASGIMASAIRQFGLGAGDAAHVADVFTLAANSTFNSVESLGEAMTYAGKVASDLGMTLEDTLAILGTLGNVGIQGSMAGTTLKRLTIISAAEAEKLKTIFGVAFTDAAGNARPLVDVLGEISTATKNLPTAIRAAKFNEAFGLLGITGAGVIGDAAAATEGLADKLKNAGAVAATTAAAMDAGPGGAWRMLTSAAEGAAIAIGDALAPTFKRLANVITESLGVVTEWIGKNQHMIDGFVRGVAIVTAFGAAVLVAGYALEILAMSIGVVSGTVAVVQSVIGTAVAAFGVYGAATVVVGGIIEATWLATAAVAAAVSTGVVLSVAVIEGAYYAVMTSAIVASGFTQLATTAIAVAWFAMEAAVSAAAIAYAVSISVVEATWWGIQAASAAAVAVVSSASTLIGLAMVALDAVVAGTSIAFAIGASLIEAAWSAIAVGSMVGSGTSSVAMGIFQAAGAAMATALTTVSGIIAAGWAIILGPVTPFVVVAGILVAVVGSIAAVAAVATVRAMDFSAAWGVAKNTLMEVFGVAKLVGSMLLSALSTGDYDIAFGAAMAGVKIILASALDGMGKLWGMFWDGAWKTSKMFFQKFLAITWDVIKAVGKAVTDPIGAARSAKAAFSKITSGDLKVSFGIDTAAIREAGKKELAALGVELTNRNAKREAEKKNGKPGATEQIINKTYTELIQQQKDAQQKLVQQQLEMQKRGQLPPGDKGLIDTAGAGMLSARRSQTLAVDAVIIGTLEGERAIQEAISLKQTDEVVSAVNELGTIFEDQSEKTRRVSMNNVKLAGSRKG
jgi:TP901 family phage tail tape measure protein